MKKIKQVIWAAAMGFVATLLAAVFGWSKGTGQSVIETAQSGAGWMPPALQNVAERQNLAYASGVKWKPSIAQTQWIGYASARHLPAAPPGQSQDLAKMTGVVLRLDRSVVEKVRRYTPAGDG